MPLSKKLRPQAQPPKLGAYLAYEKWRRAFAVRSAALGNEARTPTSGRFNDRPASPGVAAAHNRPAIAAALAVAAFLDLCVVRCA
jgi:hypothetical protein